MTIHYKKRSLKLLETAKNIFGDIVVNAYVCRCFHDDYPIKEVDEFLTLDIDTIEFTNDILNFDFIQLEFINGRIVEFQASEYCTIYSPKLDNIVTRFITL